MYDCRADVTHSTNEVESFWNHFKKSIAGTHTSIGRQYLNRYLGDFTYRANNRALGNDMFDDLIGKA